MRFLEGLSGTDSKNIVKEIVLRFISENKQKDLAYDDLDIENEYDDTLFRVPEKNTDLSKPKFDEVSFPDIKPSFFGFVPRYAKDNKKKKLVDPVVFVRMGGPERKSFYWDDDSGKSEIYCQAPERYLLKNLKDLIDFNPDTKTPITKSSNSFVYDNYPLCIDIEADGKLKFLGLDKSGKVDKSAQALVSLASKFLDMFSNWLTNTIAQMSSKEQQKEDLKLVAKALVSSLTKKDSDTLASSLASAFVATLKEELVADRIKALGKYEMEQFIVNNIIAILDPILDSIYSSFKPEKQDFKAFENTMKSSFTMVLEDRFSVVDKLLDPALGVKSIKDSEAKLDATKTSVEQTKQQEEAAKQELEKAKADAEALKEQLKNTQKAIETKMGGAKTQSLFGSGSNTVAIVLGISSLGLAGSTYHYYRKSKKS